MPRKYLAAVGAVLATAVIAASALGAAAAPTHARHPAALQFVGFGSRYLPPFQVSTPSTMIWKNTGEV